MGTTTSHALIKAFTAGAAVSKRRIVKFGAADGAVLQSAAAANFHIGVSLDLDVASGGRVDVAMANAIVELDYAGIVTRGASVTADADGKGVLATTGQRAAGYAHDTTAAGDVAGLIVAPSHGGLIVTVWIRTGI